jgi:hypothetical protein
VKFSFYALLLSAVLAAANPALISQTLVPQIEQSRQFDGSGVSSLPTDGNVLNTPMPTFAAQSPGDDDLGQQIILKSKNVYQPLSIYLGTEADYTSNVGLSENFEQEDWFWRTTAGAVYAPRFGNFLVGNLSVSQDIYRYDKFDDLNFESLNLGAGLSCNLWFFYGINAGVEFNYNRLTAEGYGDEIFSNRSLTLTLSKTFILSRAHYFYVIGAGELGWSDPEQAARDELTLLAGYHVRLARDFEVDLFYRLGFFHYTEIDREDVNQGVQLALRYNLTKWLSVNASIGGVFNNSDRPGFDYEVLNTTVGAFVSWKF